MLRLLIFAALAMLGWTDPPTAPWVYWSVTIVYGLTVAGYLASRNRDLSVGRVRAAIFLFDVAIVSALIITRGRDVQPLLMSYFTVVLLAALLAGIGRPLWNGLIGTFVYAVVMGWGRPPHELIDFALVGPAFFFFVIAVFMGHIASEARQAAEERRVMGDVSAALGRSTARLRAARDGHEAEERLRTIEVLCAGIAHELRRPIAALDECTREGAALLVDLAAGDKRAEAELRAVLEDLGHESGRLGQLVAALGRLGRGGCAQFVAVPASEVIAGVRRLTEHEFGDDVTLVDAVDTRRCVQGDPARLVHAVAILVGNARDALAAGDGGTVRLQALDDGPAGVRFVVEDDGPGIAAEVRERMFDPFYTTKGPGQGTGLGLYVAREIARAGGGTLACRSAPGRGATFALSLPMADVIPAASEAA